MSTQGSLPAYSLHNILMLVNCWCDTANVALYKCESHTFFSRERKRSIVFHSLFDCGFVFSILQLQKSIYATNKSIGWRKTNGKQIQMRTFVCIAPLTGSFVYLLLHESVLRFIEFIGEKKSILDIRGGIFYAITM